MQKDSEVYLSLKNHFSSPWGQYCPMGNVRSRAGLPRCKCRGHKRTFPGLSARGVHSAARTCIFWSGPSCFSDYEKAEAVRGLGMGRARSDETPVLLSRKMSPSPGGGGEGSRGPLPLPKHSAGTVLPLGRSLLGMDPVTVGAPVGFYAL